MFRSSADVAKSAMFIERCVKKSCFEARRMSQKVLVYDREDLVCYGADSVCHGHGFALISVMFMDSIVLFH